MPSPVLSLTTLARLNFRKNPVERLESAAELINMTSLEHIDLEETPIHANEPGLVTAILLQLTQPVDRRRLD